MKIAIDRSRIPDMEAREQEEKLWLAHDAAVKAFDDAPEGSDEEAKAKEAMDAAENALDDSGNTSLMTVDDDGEELVRCSLSGVPIFQDEPIMKDEETGEVVLKCLLGDLDDGEGRFVDPAEQEAAAA